MLRPRRNGGGNPGRQRSRRRAGGAGAGPGGRPRPRTGVPRERMTILSFRARVIASLSFHRQHQGRGSASSLLVLWAGSLAGRARQSWPGSS